MCEHERIARHGHFMVDACTGSNVLTLSLGPISLRLERRAVNQLRRLLETTYRRLVIRDEHGDDWRNVASTPDLEDHD